MNGRMEPEEFARRVKAIPELDTERAIGDLGGMWNVYEKTMRIYVRSIPQSIELMDNSLSDGDLRTFALKAHSMKGTLNQLGYRQLGELAEKLEKSAKSEDKQFCDDNYESFREKLMDFHKRALELIFVAAKGDGSGNVNLLTENIRDFADDIKKARDLIDEYDTIRAFEIIGPLSERRFGGEADNLLGKTAGELEAFNAEKAAEYINLLIKLFS